MAAGSDCCSHATTSERSTEKPGRVDAVATNVSWKWGGTREYKRDRISWSSMGKVSSSRRAPGRGRGAGAVESSDTKPEILERPEA